MQANNIFHFFLLFKTNTIDIQRWFTPIRVNFDETHNPLAFLYEPLGNIMFKTLVVNLQ